jgi:lysozyme family protein
MNFDATLRDEYHALFQTCAVDPKRKEEVECAITTILKGGKRYEAAAKAVGVPWYLVGLLHMMECSCDFRLHLHNGDPLVSKTVDVPVGRPPDPWPIPGATADELWLCSAIDALKCDGFDHWKNWTIEGILYCIEKYNGWGYRLNHHENDPYLWAASNHQMPGKYVADGKWSATAIDSQIGAAVILRRMVDQSLIEVPPIPSPSTMPDNDDVPSAAV